MNTNFNSARLLDDLVLEFSTVSGFGENEIRRAAKPDRAIAEIAKTRGIPVSEDKIRRTRLQLGVYAFPRGGARLGAGRRLGSGAGRSWNKSRCGKKAVNGHHLGVGVGDLVINFGRELYDKTGDNIWDQERGKYIARERYTPTPEGRATGLFTGHRRWHRLQRASAENGTGSAGRIFRSSKQSNNLSALLPSSSGNSPGAFFFQEHILQEVILVIAENDIFLTAAEAMKILRLKKSTFYSYVAQSIIPSIKIGHFLRFRRADIINFGK